MNMLIVEQIEYEYDYRKKTLVNMDYVKTAKPIVIEVLNEESAFIKIEACELLIVGETKPIVINMSFDEFVDHFATVEPMTLQKQLIFLSRINRLENQEGE